MRVPLLTTAIAACVIATAAAQNQTTPQGPTAIPPTQPGVPTTPVAQPPNTVPPPGTFTLNGCVGAGATSSAPFTLSGATIVPSSPAPAGAPSASTPGVVAPTVSANGYRLSGMDVSPFAGQRVQIVGALVPSPNAAATAGAISSGSDQNAAAGALANTPPVGTQPGTPVGTVGTTPPPEFRVTSVMPVTTGTPCK